MPSLKWAVGAAFCLFLSGVVGAQAGEVGSVSAAGKNAESGAAGARGEEAFPDPEATFKEVMDMLLKQHVDRSLTPEILYKAAIDGMLERASLELTDGKICSGEERNQPSNCLLSPRSQTAMNDWLGGRRVGIGVRLDTHATPGWIDVIGVMRGLPAERAGLKARDRILRIDGQRLDDKSEMEMLELFRGPAGSTIKLQVQRGAQQLEIPITRELIQLETASGEILPPDIGVLRIYGFVDQTPRLVKGILLELKSRGIKGLVLDLRDNPGGMLESTLQVLDLLQPKGSLILELEHRDGKREQFRSRGDPILNVPMVVLINDRTRSSAEVVAQALRHQAHARLVGQRTYGKATAEEILELRNGYAAKISRSRLLSPRGDTWEGVGIAPDVVVKDDPTVVDQAVIAPTVEERLRLDQSLNRAIQLLAR